MDNTAASRINVRQLRNYERDFMKLILFSFTVCMMMFPLLSGNAFTEHVTVETSISQNTIAEDDLLLTILLTHSSHRIATGNVEDNRGFAYPDEFADEVRFVDPINGITLNQTIELGTLTEETFTGVDIDDDGSTEFLVLNDNGTAINLLIIDFNDATTTKHNLSINQPTGISTGDFNGDSNLDVVIFHGSHAQNVQGVLTLDIQTDQVIGNFSTPGFAIDCYAIGHFLEPSEDSLALGIYDAAKDGNFTLIAGNGTIMRTTMMHTEILGLAQFDYGPGLDDLAAIMFDGNLTVFSPDTMTTHYNITGLPERSLVTTGFLNHDSQTDFLVAPTDRNHSVFIDGTNGSIFRYSEEINGISQGPISGDPPAPLIDYGHIDADNLTDFAILSGDGGDAAYLRGIDGNIGYQESTISSKPVHVRVYDVNNNSRDDMLFLESQFVYIMLSDVQAPIISPEPLAPPHPTIQDPYIEIEVGIEEETSVIQADIYIRYEDGNWTQPIDELQNAGTQYFAFLVGLPEGYYDYYLLFQDTYLNIETLGNQTHPMNFTIAGHLAWSDSKNQMGAFDHHLMDIGNASDGSEVIYTLDSIMDTIYLDRYSTRGENVSLGIVSSNAFSDFWIYTGMMDGDDILDPIILLYNATAEVVNVTIYHGSTGTFWYSTQYPGTQCRAVQSAQTYDCDSDGIDEFFFVFENSTTDDVYLVRLKSDGSWSNLTITGSNSEFYGVSFAKTVNDQSVEATVSASTGDVDIINATSMTMISSHNVTSTEYDFTIPVYVYNFHNASEPRTKFLLYMYFIDGGGISYGFHVFDGNTPKINETTLFHRDNELYISLQIIDVEGDGTDEIVGISYITGDVALLRLADPVIVEWSIPLSNSDFLSSVIVDFDGDAEDEIGVFTDQDQMLRIVSLDGVIERELLIGQGHGCMKLSNIDLGYGEEIVSYPLVQNGVTKIGVIRDIVLIRRLNASLTYSSMELSQSEQLSVYVDVTNIYSEVISDAEVYFTVHYKSGTNIINQTSLLIFESSNYTTTLAAAWPMGIVNFSLTVNHILYDVWDDYYPNTLTITSPLNVEVYTSNIVLQNDTLPVDVTVTDSLGTRVSDATVTISLNGTDYPTTFSNDRHRLTIPNIDLIPGEYEVNASANHLYAENPVSASEIFRLETNEIQIGNSIPAIIEQDEEFAGWINITDIFDNPIEDAEVMIAGASLELFLTELDPGCYYLDSTASFGVGNHTFDIFVDHDFVQGSSFGDFQISTVGIVTPNVPDIGTVPAGELFNVTVIVNDQYGITPSDTWVNVEIDGQNVTATKISGNTFRATVNATYSIGEHQFIVYYGSDYIHDGHQEYPLNVRSDPIITVNPSEDWTVGQGNSTLIEVDVKDWLLTSIEDASVTLVIRGTTYTLDHINGGVYQTNISTVGWRYDFHPYLLTVDHEYLYQSQIVGNLTVIADPIITIRPSTNEPEQFSTFGVTVEVTDLYENPVEGLEVVVEFAGMSEVAEESERGVYIASFDVGDTYHNTYSISVLVEGEKSIPGTSSTEVYVEVYSPEGNVLSAETITLAGGISLILSLIGMILFVKVSSAISTTPMDTDDVTRSLRQLDRIYVLIVALSGVLFLHSWTLYSAGEYALALLESIILLGSSVLLYGLWLYRDAYSSILVNSRLSLRRIGFGVWHLILVPFIVMLIFTYGPGFEYFQRYVLDVPQIVFGDFSIPPLLATVLATYMSSIVVVVISFYREIRKGLKRIEDMVSSGTPQNVVDEEQVLLIGRVGSSIRIKFLIFLLIIGATTVTQLDFILENYSMAAIILLPILFLVLIPFISSRIVKAVPNLFRRLRGSTTGEPGSIPTDT